MATELEGPSFGGSGNFSGPSVPLREMPKEIGKAFKELAKAYSEILLGAPLVLGYVAFEGTRMGYRKLRDYLKSPRP